MYTLSFILYDVVCTIAPRMAKSFTQSLRNTGYTGDIVVATVSTLTLADGIIDVFKKTDCIMYPVDLSCTSMSTTSSDHRSTTSAIYDVLQRCQFRGVAGTGYPIPLIRYYLYIWWATLYDSNAIILLTDFSDVLFQSNPFEYITHIWTHPKYQLTVFQEAFPNRMLYRNRLNKGFIEECYGSNVVQSIGHNPISSVGTVLGVKDAVFAYVRTEYI